jgi:hypothetical protein
MRKILLAALAAALLVGTAQAEPSDDRVYASKAATVQVYDERCGWVHPMWRWVGRRVAGIEIERQRLLAELEDKSYGEEHAKLREAMFCNSLAPEIKRLNDIAKKNPISGIFFTDQFSK